jgi:hypothetical protein
LEVLEDSIPILHEQEIENDFHTEVQEIADAVDESQLLPYVPATAAALSEPRPQSIYVATIVSAGSTSSGQRRVEDELRRPMRCFTLLMMDSKIDCPGARNHARCPTDPSEFVEMSQVVRYKRKRR